MANPENVEKIMKILSKYFSSFRKTTLNRMHREDPFKILVSCLISLRTQDKNTEKVVSNLFKFVKNPEDLAKMPTKKLEKIIYSSGFYKRKAKILKHVAKVLIEKYNGKIPEKREELVSIKGIGQKTANIVLAFAFNKRVLPIDTHCHRIPNRIGWVKTKRPEETEKALEKILPKRYWKDFNGIFVLFGRTICKPITPLCSKCPIESYCKKIGVKISK